MTTQLRAPWMLTARRAVDGFGLGHVCFPVARRDVQRMSDIYRRQSECQQSILSQHAGTLTGIAAYMGIAPPAESHYKEAYRAITQPGRR